MYPELLNEGTRKTRKAHQCFHCYQRITKGTKAKFSTLKYDGVYTLYFHEDCAECWTAYSNDTDLSAYDYFDGYPPLLDDWQDSGEFEKMCNAYRGKFPHVVCRMELPEQKKEWMNNIPLYG